jgi:hypothetical protein
MARIDDYKNAVLLSKKDLKNEDLKELIEKSGAEPLGASGLSEGLRIKFLNKKIFISWPDMDISLDAEGGEISLQEQVLILHYLKGAGRSETEGDWIAYQDIPDGKFYLDAFNRRAKVPLVKTFGERPEILERLASEVYGAVPFDHGDVSVKVAAFPKVPVALIIWRGDDEFPPEGNIIFDRSISSILPAEDVAWLAGMIVYPLMGMAGGMS